MTDNGKPSCERCDSTGCPECDLQWTKHQVRAPDNLMPDLDKALRHSAKLVAKGMLVDSLVSPDELHRHAYVGESPIATYYPDSGVIQTDAWISQARRLLNGAADQLAWLTRELLDTTAEVPPGYWERLTAKLAEPNKPDSLLARLRMRANILRGVDALTDETAPNLLARDVDEAADHIEQLERRQIVYSPDAKAMSDRVEQQERELIAARDCVRVYASHAGKLEAAEAKVEQLRRERDAQYDENVSRIAAEGAAVNRATAAERERDTARTELQVQLNIRYAAEARLARITKTADAMRQAFWHTCRDQSSPADPTIDAYDAVRKS